MCGGGSCGEGICSKCQAVMKVVLGGLILLNIYVIKWTGSFEKWAQFIAALLILKGVIKFVKPCCGHCKGEMTAPSGKKGK